MPTPTWGASLAALAPAISVNPPLLLIVLSRLPSFWGRKGEYRRAGGNVKKTAAGAAPGGSGPGAQGIHAVDEEPDPDRDQRDREDAQPGRAQEVGEAALPEGVLLFGVQVPRLDLLVAAGAGVAQRDQREE